MTHHEFTVKTPPVILDVALGERGVNLIKFLLDLLNMNWMIHGHVTVT
jgi:hypothetical protein